MKSIYTRFNELDFLEIDEAEFTFSYSRYGDLNGFIILEKIMKLKEYDYQDKISLIDNIINSVIYFSIDLDFLNKHLSDENLVELYMAGFNVDKNSGSLIFNY